MIDKIGTYNHKPLFLIIFPFPISLKPKGEELMYDAESFYSYENMATKGNLLKNVSEMGGLGDFLKKYWIIIVVVIIAIILFTTPQGQEILGQLIPSLKQ
jgi:hypothetical protein